MQDFKCKSLGKYGIYKTLRQHWNLRFHNGIGAELVGFYLPVYALGSAAANALYCYITEALTSRVISEKVAHMTDILTHGERRT